MQIGNITVDGRIVGIVALDIGGAMTDPFMPDIEGYEPEGRATETPHGPAPEPAYHHHGASLGDMARRGHATAPQMGPEGRTHASESSGAYKPQGKKYKPDSLGSPVAQGSAATDQAIVEAAKAHHFDPNFMRSVASIESGMNPSSNANRSTQYKGLFQLGVRGRGSEWERFGNGGNPYSARDNAMATARAWEANRTLFRKHFGRDPTETELYLMHQQGLGFYTRGTMTNIKGNPYPGMHGPQTHASFEAGWGREVERRKERFAKLHPEDDATNQQADINFDPETMVP